MSNTISCSPTSALKTDFTIHKCILVTHIIALLHAALVAHQTFSNMAHMGYTLFSAFHAGATQNL